MRYWLLSTLFLLGSTISYAQEVSVSPTSLKLWGETPGFSSVSVSYQNIGAHFFYPYQKHYWEPQGVRRYRNGRVHSPDEGTGQYLKHPTYILDGRLVDPDYETKPSFALSYSPINIKDIISAGVIVFDKPFPSKPAQRVNMILEIGYTFGKIRISYNHISNAWTGDINPGLDMVSFSIMLK